ncbi:hypothetical protein EV1_000075 [Malus domestica]
MGKLVGKELDARTIKWKLGLTWDARVKNLFYLDHFRYKWYAIEFTDEEKLEFELENRPWYVRGQILHMEKANETTLYRINGLVVRVLLKVDLRPPLKRILVVNDDEECLLLLSYEKLFEVCFYCGMRRIDKHACPTDYDNDGCLLVDRILEDAMLVCPADFPMSDETKSELHDGVMLLFPQPNLLDEFGSTDRETPIRGENVQEHNEEEEDWNIVSVRRSRNVNRGRSSAHSDGKSYENVVRGQMKVSKGKSVKEVIDLDTDEVFMETEDGEIKQVQAGGNKKRIRSEAKCGKGPSYNLEDVD